MIQLNSWKKLQIGHLCSGNGCFKREKTLFYDMQILFPTFTFTFTYVHISITKGSPFTPFEFEIHFFGVQIILQLTIQSVLVRIIRCIFECKCDAKPV